MNRLRYVLTARADLVKPQQYEIDWLKIAQDVREAAEQLANYEKEPDMKKKNGKKKKGY